MMNHLKIVTVGCAVALTVSSLDSQAAATRADGLNACVEAVVTEISNSQGSPVEFSLSPDSEMTSTKLQRREVFHLDVRSPNTDGVVARADCVVNHNAQVRKLIDLPLDARDAKERSKAALY